MNQSQDYPSYFSKGPGFPEKLSSFFMLHKYLLANTTKDIEFKTDTSDNIETITGDIGFDIRNTIGDPEDSRESWKILSLSKQLKGLSHLGLNIRYLMFGRDELLSTSIEHSDKFVVFLTELLNYYQYVVKLGDTEIIKEIQESMRELFDSICISGFYCIDEFMGYSELTQSEHGFDTILSDNEYANRYYEILELFENLDQIIDYMKDFPENEYLDGLSVSKNRYNNYVLPEMSVLLSLYKINYTQYLYYFSDEKLGEILDPTSPHIRHILRMMDHWTKWVIYNILHTDKYNAKTLYYLHSIILIIYNSISKYQKRGDKWQATDKDKILSDLSSIKVKLNRISSLILSSSTM